MTRRAQLGINVSVVTSYRTQQDYYPEVYTSRRMVTAACMKVLASHLSYPAPPNPQTWKHNSPHNDQLPHPIAQNQHTGVQQSTPQNHGNGIHPPLPAQNLHSELQILIWKYAFNSWVEGLELYLSTTATWRRTTPDEPGSLTWQKSLLVMACQPTRSVALERWEKTEWHESLKGERLGKWQMRCRE